MSNSINTTLIKNLVADRLAAYKSTKAIKQSYQDDIVYGGDPEGLINIHLFEGIEKVAEIYNEKVVFDEDNLHFLPAFKHGVSISVDGETVTFYQIKKIEREETITKKLLRENEALKTELEMIKSGSQSMGNQ